jgi:hypothetical protein
MSLLRSFLASLLLPVLARAQSEEAFPLAPPPSELLPTIGTAVLLHDLSRALVLTDNWDDSFKHDTMYTFVIYDDEPSSIRSRASRLVNS